jgi:hypothetical protein
MSHDSTLPADRTCAAAVPAAAQGPPIFIIMIYDKAREVTANTAW